MADNSGLTQTQLDSLGTDIAWGISPNTFLEEYASFGDLEIAKVVDPTTMSTLGDVNTKSGISNLNAALGRRLVTPLYQLGRFIADINTVRAVDFDYGTGIYSKLSEPIENSFVGSTSDLIFASLQREPRINVNFVKVLSVQPATSTVSYEIDYQIPETNSTRNAVLTFVSGNLAELT
jgi:hypothetical protein